MAELGWSVSIQVSGGPNLTMSAATRTIEATDRVSVSIAPGDTDRIVDLQPGTAAAIRLLAIQSSFYGPQLSFVASDGTDGSAAIILDGPQIYTAGSAALFTVAPQRLLFTNTSPDQTAEIEVFVARDATP